MTDAARARRFQLLAFIDDGTGLPNSRAFGTAYRRRLKRFANAGVTIGLLVSDLTDFGRFSARCGWKVGTDALCAYAHAAGCMLRHNRDLLCRVHGDEFVAIIEVTTREALERVAARIAGPVSFRVGNRSQPITSTVVGVLARRRDPDKLFEIAERQLRATKRRNRERTAITDPAFS